MTYRFCNGLPGLATAFADRSPVFCITSSPPLRDAETNTLQGLHDQVVIAKPMTKFAHRITNAEEIPRIVALGYRTAVASPPGPVLLDFPIDVLFTPPQASRISWGSITRPLPLPPGPNAESVRLILDALRNAERPAIVASTGSRGEECARQLQQFAETHNIPVFNSMKFSNSFPRDHPLRAGNATRMAILPHIGQKQADLIILLGARTGFILGGRSGRVIPNENVKLIQVDVDGSEIGRSHAVDVGVISDVTQALIALNAAASTSAKKASDEWVKVATSLKNLPSPFENAPLEESPGRAHPYHAVKAVLSSLEPGAIVCIDGGEAGCWVQDLVETTARASLYMSCTGYLGFLGNGWGYALGAAVAEPGRQVVNMQGDGSACFHVAELDTYSRHQLNILTVVVNNFCWGMSKAGQHLIYGGITDARPVSKLSPKTDFSIVAQGFGATGAKVDKVEDVAAAVKKLSSAQGPGCIDLIVNDQPIHPLTRSMVGNEDSDNMIVVPYYDNLPRPYYKS